MVKLNFSGTIRARAVKLGTSIHLVKEAECAQNNKVITYISRFTNLTNYVEFPVKLNFSGTIRTRVMKLGTSIHLVKKAECAQNNKVITYISRFADLTKLCRVSC